MTPSTERALEIDGIRGWASFLVLLYHVFHEIFTRLLPWINSAWLAPFFDGRIAVCVFFVLSGDALSANFISQGSVNPLPIDRLVVRRYCRLTIPILMSCLLVFILRMAGADWHDEAAAITSRGDWLGQLIEFQFSAVGLVRYALLGVYTSHSNATSYNPFLWTMSVEMVGSMLVFLSCYLWPRLRNPKRVVAGAAFALFAMNSFLCLFFAGMYLGALRSEAFYATAMSGRTRQVASLAAFFSLILLLVVSYGHHMPLFFDLAVSIAFVFVLYSQQGLRILLRGRLSTWLGDISFPVYLVQFAVIISLESWLVVEWRATQAGSVWLPVIGVVTVGTTLAVAWAFRQIERRSLGLADAQVLRLLQRN